MKKYLKKAVMCCMVACMLIGSLGSMETEAKSSKKMSISSKKITLQVGQSKKLKIKNVTKGKKVKWSSNKKKIATVSKKGVVKAKKNGTCKITAKVSGKKFTCTVKVTKKVKKKTDTTTEEVKEETTTEEPKKPNEPSKPVNPVNPTPEPIPSVDDRTPYQICMEEGHIVVETIKPSTKCTLGTLHEFKCSRCNNYLGSERDNDALGHDYVVIENIEATCEKDGRTVTKCTRCGDIQRKNNYKTGHDLYTVERKEATCGEEGYYVEKCRHEGCTYEKRHTLAKKKVHEGGITMKREWHPEIQVDDRNLATEGWGSIAHIDKYYCAGCGEWLNSTLNPPDSQYKIPGEEYLRIIDSCSSISDEAKRLSHQRYEYYLQHNK